VVLLQYVIRGYLLPIYDENKDRPTFVKVQTVEELKNAWERFISLLRDVVTELNKLLGDVDEKKKIRVFADIITLLFKTPMIIPPSIEDAKPLIESPGYMLILGIINRARGIPFKINLYKYDREEIQDRTLALFNKLIELNRKMTEKELPSIARIRDRDVMELVRKIFFDTPADPRPLLNTSSLVVHLLTTSALAWSLASNDGNTEEADMIRLAALFHDIGKPIDWKRYAEKSAEIFKSVFENVLSEETLNRIVEIILNHHEQKPTKVAAYITQADKIISGIDELSQNIELLMEKLPDIPDNIKQIIIDWIKGIKEWEAFEDLLRELGSIEKIADLYSKLIEKFVEIMSKGELIEKGSKDTESEEITGVSLVKIDTREIQNFIFSGSRIPEISGGSLLVDLLVMYDIPMAIAEKEVPMECILYSAGGNLTLLIPERVYSKVAEAIKEVFDSSVIYKPLGYVMERTTLKVDIKKSFVELEQKINAKKYLIGTRNRTSLDLPPIAYVCDSCKEYPAVDVDVVGEDEDRLCIYCLAKRQFGRLFTFRSKLLSLEKNESLWKNILRLYIMEYIAGHSIEELEKGEIEEYLDLAVIKSDGNLMGYYMGIASSLADLVERSYRIDLAMKKAYTVASDIIKKELETVLGNSMDAREWIERVYLGTIFMGGDDIFIILPAYISLPFALIVMETFHKELGYHQKLSPTLSLGIIAGKPKAPIWSLIETAMSLLNTAKDRGRKFGSGGALAFLVSKSLVFTSESARTFLQKISKERLSAQPYILSGKPRIYDLLEKLFDITFGQNYRERIEGIKQLIRRYVRFYFDARKRREGIENLKEPRRHLLKVLSVAQTDREISIPTAAIYTLRESARRGVQQGKRYYEMIIEVARDVSEDMTKLCLPLIDMIFLIDLLGGGTI